MLRLFFTRVIMEKIWSPWRSQYIESFKEKKCKDTGCVFCDALTDKNTEESLLLHRDENTFVVMNLYPYNNGHLMVVPNRHLSDFTELSEIEHAEIMKNVKKAILALKEVMKPHGFNYGANIGKAAGAGIDTHLHFHIVPRWNGDTNFMPVLGEVKLISQDLMITKNKLIKAFEKL